MTKFKHKEKRFNLESPSIIVPEIIKLLNPKSVVDIGCGLGTFIHVLKTQV
jgi:tRNA1(Val) A37 N6-methylase TrmN6